MSALEESGKRLRLAVDIGGTFVDAMEFDVSTRQIRFRKALTTPAAPWEGVLQAVTNLESPLDEVDLFIHGTTLGLNAVLERKGARTGIITNEGMRDIFLLGRGGESRLGWAVDGDDRGRPGRQGFQVLAATVRGDKQDAVDRVAGHLFNLRLLNGGVPIGSCQPDEVAGLARRVLDGMADNGKEAVRKIGDDQANGF